MTIAERVLQIIRSNKKLSQKAMSQSIGVAPTTVNYWLKSGNSIPAEYVKPIADYLNVSCEFLLIGSDSAPDSLSNEDKEWFDLIHQLPEDAKPVMKGMIEGYVKDKKV